MPWDHIRHLRHMGGDGAIGATISGLVVWALHNKDEVWGYVKRIGRAIIAKRIGEEKERQDEAIAKAVAKAMVDVHAAVKAEMAQQATSTPVDPMPEQKVAT